MHVINVFIDSSKPANLERLYHELNAPLLISDCLLFYLAASLCALHDGNIIYVRRIMPGKNLVT